MAGGGIGEAALIGAAVGGGTAALTGQNMLEGIVKGGLLGGVGGAAFGGAGGGAGAGAGGGGAAAAGPISQGAAANGIVTNALVGGDVAKGLALNGSLLAGSPGFALAPEAMAAPTITSAANAVPSVANIPGFAANTPSLMSTAANAVTEQPGFFGGLMDKYKALSIPEKIGVGIAGSTLLSKLMEPNYLDEGGGYQPLKRFTYDPRKFRPTVAYADGGITNLPGGNISVGGDPRRNIPPINQTSNFQQSSFPVNYMADGGITNLGHYSDGGSLLRGPGDGVSDGIPAMIGRKQPARLADGEFVVPARIVSELGNGSTDAGARQLYKMMDRVQARRGKTTGKDRMAVDSKARKLLPA